MTTLSSAPGGAPGKWEFRRERSRPWLMVVLGLLFLVTLGLLVMAIVYPEEPNPDIARRAAARARLPEIATEAVLFKLDTGKYPATLQDLTLPPSVAGAAPYLDKVPLDPWGQPYRFQAPGRHNSECDVWSLGPDKLDGTADDIGNWK